MNQKQQQKLQNNYDFSKKSLSSSSITASYDQEKSSGQCSTTPFSQPIRYSNETIAITAIYPDQFQLNNQTSSKNQNRPNCNPLSEYEKLRARNIERNNKRMVELNLMSEEEAKMLNEKAWKKDSDDDGDDYVRHNSRGKKSCRIGGGSGGSGSDNSGTKNQRLNKQLHRPSDVSSQSDANGIKQGQTGIVTRQTKNVHSARRRAKRKKPFEAEGIWV